MESSFCQSDPDSSPRALSLSLSLSARLSVSCLATGLGVFFVASFQKCRGFKCAPLQARHPHKTKTKKKNPKMFLIIFLILTIFPNVRHLDYYARSIQRQGCKGIQKEKDFLNYYCYYGEFLVQIWSAVLFDEP
jgi:hypothetical protein